MRRNYTWRLKDGRWQKITRIPANVVNTSSGTSHLVLTWLHTTNGPYVSGTS